MIPLWPPVIKRSFKNESPLISVASCVSSLKHHEWISWLYIFRNAGSWSIESLSDVCKLLCKLSHSTKIWSKSLLTQWNICFTWVQHNAYNALHAHRMPTISPNNLLFPWWKNPSNPSSLSCKLDQDLSWWLHLLIAYTIRAILRFQYLDILTTFLFFRTFNKKR